MGANSQGERYMAWDGIPPLWIDIVGAVRPHIHRIRLVSDLATRHALSETMGATTVSPAPSRKGRSMIGPLLTSNSQHNPRAFHGSNLLLCLVSFVSILSTCGLFRSHPRLLRGLRDRQLFLPPLQLHRARSPQSERLL